MQLQMRVTNAKRLEELEAAILDAEENLGDVEVRSARAAKAEYLCKIGEGSVSPVARPRFGLEIKALNKLVL